MPGAAIREPERRGACGQVTSRDKAMASEQAISREEGITLKGAPWWERNLAWLLVAPTIIMFILFAAGVAPLGLSALGLGLALWMLAKATA